MPGAHETPAPGACGARIRAIEKMRKGFGGPRPYHFSMTAAQKTETRTLTVVLNEADWRAFRAVEPDAIGWLHERIQERLAPTRSAEAAPPDSPTLLGGFED